MEQAGTSRPGLAMREEHLARRIKYEMNRRGWSQERMAAEVTKAGLSLHQSAVSKIINPGERGKRRTISVDEALAFARVFDTPLDELLSPVAVAKSRELKRVVEEIASLSDQWNEILNRIDTLWTRAAELMSEEEAIDAYADQLMEEGMTRAGAISNIKGWLDEAEARYATTAMKAKSRELGVEYAQFAARQKAVIAEALEILENRDKYDSGKLDEWIERNKDVLSGFWLARSVIDNVARLKRHPGDAWFGEEKDIEDGIKWLRTIDESLTRRMERGESTYDIGHDSWGAHETS